MEAGNRNSVGRVSVEKTSQAADESTGLTVLALVAMLCSVGAGVVMFEAHTVKKDDFYSFAVYLLDVMEQPGYIQTLVNGTYFVSLVLYLSSFALATASILNKKRLAKVALVFTFLASVFVVVGGVVSLDYISGVDSDVNQGQPTLTGRAREIQDFSIAMYDKCCLQEGFVDATTAAFLRYIDEEDIDIAVSQIKTCAQLYSDRTTNLQQLEGALEPCIGNELHLQWFRGATIDWMCEILNSTTVDVTSASLSGLALSNLISLEEIVIASPADRSSYGCGGGKIKAFQYTCYIWFQNTCRPVAFTLIAIGSVCILLSFFGMASLCLSNTQRESEYDMAVIEAYLNRNSARLEVPENFGVRPSSTRIPVAAPVNVDDKI